MFKYLLISLIILFNSISALGQSVCGISSNIYYINGINKPEESEVRLGSVNLKNTILTHTKNYNGISKVTYLYNDSQGIFMDVFYELSAQKALEKKTNVSDEFVAIGLTALGIENTLIDAETSVIQKKYAALLVATLPPTTLALISKFSTAIQDSLISGKQTIIVPHSQGNMFANELFDGLKLTMPAYLFRGLGIVNVANPASRAPSDLYITTAQDLVINVVAFLQSFFSFSLWPMPQNFDGSFSVYSKDKTGHGFTEVYLAKDLPSGTSPENSIAATLVQKIDSAILKTSTFYDPLTYVLVNGVKVKIPASSATTQVCFPDPIGGV